MKKQIVMMLLFFCNVALADVPQLINYQGKLTDAQGQPKTGNANLSFEIYDGAGGGAAKVWGPQNFTNVPLINGQFNIILGTTDSAGNPIANAFVSPNAYLQITDLGINAASAADDIVISPRQQILSTPYAMQAKNADHAVQADNSTSAEYAWQADVAGPIGTIVAWHKNFGGMTQTLPHGWVELSGGSVNDPASPFHGKALPNLNMELYAAGGGKGRYLRGGYISGLMNESTYYTDNGSGYTGPAGAFYGYGGGKYHDVDYVNKDQSSYSGSRLGAVRRFQTAAMTVVWIMRIK